MHTYNPLELPEIITNIVYNLALADLNKLCWINGTWYKQVQQELRKKCENQMVKYYKKCRKRDNEIKKSNKIISGAYHDVLLSNLLKYRCADKIESRYKEILFIIAKRQIKIERIMFINGMLNEQEKEIVKYNIHTLSKEVIPWEYKDYEWENGWCYKPSQAELKALRDRVLILIEKLKQDFREFIKTLQQTPKPPTRPKEV